MQTWGEALLVNPSFIFSTAKLSRRIFWLHCLFLWKWMRRDNKSSSIVLPVLLSLLWGPVFPSQIHFIQSFADLLLTVHSFPDSASHWLIMLALNLTLIIVSTHVHTKKATPVFQNLKSELITKSIKFFKLPPSLSEAIQGHLMWFN